MALVIIGDEVMKSVTKVFVYVFISFCIADTVASDYLGMQLTLLVSLLASGLYEAIKQERITEGQ